MALGGGTFTFQNKVLPGTYINFVSAASASASLSDRGIAAMPLETDWGPEGDIFEVTSGDFIKNSLTIFGYDYTNDKMKGLRDLFIGAKTLYAYRLNGADDLFETGFYDYLDGGWVVAVEWNERVGVDPSVSVDIRRVDDDTRRSRLEGKGY